MNIFSSNQIWQQIWQNLEQGSKNSDDDCHRFVLSYRGEKTFPEICMVINRGINIEENTLSFHTDVRSHKYKNLSKNSEVSLLFYVHQEAVQLRMKGKAKIQYNNSIALAEWNLLPVVIKEYFSQPQVHGEIFEQNKQNLSLEQAYQNFARIDIHLKQIDYLNLKIEGHLRYIFELEKNSYQAVRVAP